MPDPTTYVPLHKSPVTQRYYITPDSEGRATDLKKTKQYISELTAAFPIQSATESAAAEVDLGDWTDHGDSPLEAVETAAKKRRIPGNRDLNFTRFLYEVDPAYITFVYESLKKITADKVKYAQFFDDKGQLKNEAGFFKAAEETPEFHYQHSSGAAIPLTWTTAADKIGFAAWADAAVVRSSSVVSAAASGSASSSSSSSAIPASFLALDDLAKQVLYLQYQNEFTRGAPDGVMNWAIDFANKVDNGATKDFKKIAKELYAECKKNAGDAAKYRDAYLKMRAHLNKGHGLTSASATDVLAYQDSFEELMVKWYKQPTEIMNLLRTAEIVITIGTAGNKVLLVHGGITVPEDLSLPDGQQPAQSIEEFVRRYNAVRDRFFTLYDKTRDKDENKEFIILARGFALMSLPRQALQDTQIHDHPHLKGATASVDNIADVGVVQNVARNADEADDAYEQRVDELNQAATDNLKQHIFNGYVGQINGHQPSNQFFAKQILGDKFKLGIDTTYNNFKNEVTVAAVYVHQDGSQTTTVHAKDASGVSRSIEIGTFTELGARIWPRDPNQIIQQVLFGATITLPAEKVREMKGKDLDALKLFSAADTIKVQQTFLLEDWRAQYLENGNITLHKGGAFKKEDGTMHFFNSTVTLDWKTVAQRSNRDTSINNALFMAGRRLSTDKTDLLNHFETTIAAAKSLGELETFARLYHSNIDSHRNPRWDRLWLNTSRWVSPKTNTASWLACKDQLVIRSAEIIEKMSKNNSFNIDAVKQFDLFLTNTFGPADLRDWYKVSLPDILIDAVMDKVETTDLLAQDAAMAITAADGILSTIDKYSSPLKERIKGLDFVDIKVKHNFKNACLAKTREFILEQLTRQLPVMDLANPDASAAAFQGYIEKLTNLKQHQLFAKHQSWYGFGRNGFETSTQGSIDSLIKQAVVLRDAVPKPAGLVI